MDKFKCKDCKKFKVRRPCGHNSRGETVYEDRKHFRWNGRQCHQCMVAYSNNRYRLKSQNKPHRQVDMIGGVIEADPLTDRKCTECNKRLPKSRYFTHRECDEKVRISEGSGFYSAEDWGYGVNGITGF